jgi:hypothetical protein
MLSMTFYEIEFPLAGLESDAVEAALMEAGASSITFLDRADEPILEPKPGEIRLWSDTLVRALFQQSSDSPESPRDAVTRDALKNLKLLSSTLGAHVTETARIRAVEDQAWERVWLKDWKSMRFGRRLWVVPSAAELPQDPEAVVVRLDPGLAFGTGTHPTTALCLQILDSVPLQGRSVIDYGIEVGRNPRRRSRHRCTGPARDARERDPQSSVRADQRARHPAGAHARPLRSGQYSRRPIGATGAATDRRLRAWRLLAALRPVETTSLRGKGRVRRGF